MSAAQPLLNPVEKVFKGSDGVGRLYRLGDIPYLSGGREIATQFVPTGAPKVGDYKANEELSLKIFSFVEAQDVNGHWHRLSSRDLVNNHIPDFQTGIQIEYAMLEKCLGFSVAGKIQGFLSEWNQNFPAAIMKILTQLLQSLQKPDNAPSQSSGASTASKT